MAKNFFQGSDFKHSPFKALIPKYYTKPYQTYIKEESRLLQQRLRGSQKVLEAGVGIGRLLPLISSLADEVVGIDVAPLMLTEARRSSKDLANVKIRRMKIENVSAHFPPRYFQHTLCLWNTLGNVTNELVALKNLKKVTREKIIITTHLKGALPARLAWYKKMGIEIKKVDKETVYSQSGLKSKAYNRQDIKDLALKTGLKVDKMKILGKVVLYAELSNTTNA